MNHDKPYNKFRVSAILAQQKYNAPSGFADGYIEGAEEQERLDHCQQHLDWILEQHTLYIVYKYECIDKQEKPISFEEWIRKLL